MADYIIRVDSSVEPSYMTGSSGSLRLIKSGKATVGWTTERKNEIVAAGLIYYDYNGPNKAMYEGVLAALSQLETDHFNPAGSDTIKVLIDIELVIDQINGNKNAIKMAKHLDRVKSFCERHKNVSCKFLYQNEKDSKYKKVDIISKEGRAWMKEKLSS